MLKIVSFFLKALYKFPSPETSSLGKRSIELSKNQTFVMNELCSWTAIIEQAATRYPAYVNLCCFVPVTENSMINIDRS
jgi:hypothetical protein